MKRLAIVLTVFLSAAMPLEASSAVRLDFLQLSRLASQVVAGRILSITSDVDPATGYIFSDVTLALTYSIPAAQTGRPFQFRMLGGEHGGKRLSISDLPELRNGQEVILFLNQETSGILGPTVGLWQGVFFVGRGGETGRTQVLDHMRRPVLGIRGSETILGLKESGPRSGADSTASAALTVARFMEQVQIARLGRAPEKAR